MNKKYTIIHRSKGFYDIIDNEKQKIIFTRNHPDNIFSFLAQQQGNISFDFKDETVDSLKEQLYRYTKAPITKTPTNDPALQTVDLSKLIKRNDEWQMVKAMIDKGKLPPLKSPHK